MSQTLLPAFYFYIHLQDICRLKITNIAVFYIFSAFGCSSKIWFAQKDKSLCDLPEYAFVNREGWRQWFGQMCSRWSSCWVGLWRSSLVELCCRGGLKRSGMTATTEDVWKRSGKEFCTSTQYCSKVWGHFLKKSILLFSKDAWYWSKVTVKTFMMQQNILVSNKHCSFQRSARWRIQKNEMYQFY